jgi:hypothetical protein
MASASLTPVFSPEYGYVLADPYGQVYAQGDDLDGMWDDFKQWNSRRKRKRDRENAEKYAEEADRPLIELLLRQAFFTALKWSAVAGVSTFALSRLTKVPIYPLTVIPPAAMIGGAYGVYKGFQLRMTLKGGGFDPKMRQQWRAYVDDD